VKKPLWMITGKARAERPDPPKFGVEPEVPWGWDETAFVVGIVAMGLFLAWLKTP